MQGFWGLVVSSGGVEGLRGGIKGFRGYGARVWDNKQDFRGLGYGLGLRVGFTVGCAQRSPDPFMKERTFKLYQYTAGLLSLNRDVLHLRHQTIGFRV